ncbi:hypothetical protein ACIBI9_30485 [Nonomuraea sp. NPDC050451]|uniref:hypothetical protein n=1 Tax=Nonomuraea sp. NPDC050451 TaxID=3364364 RepID=UPI00379786B9
MSTQTANGCSMRLAATMAFTEVGMFEEYGAEQWFAHRTRWRPIADTAPDLGKPG